MPERGTEERMRELLRAVEIGEAGAMWELRAAYVAWSREPGRNARGHLGVSGGCAACRAWGVLSRAGLVRVLDSGVVEEVGEREEESEVLRALTRAEAEQWLWRVRQRGWQAGDPPFLDCQ